MAREVSDGAVRLSGDVCSVAYAICCEYDHIGKYLQCQSNETTSILTNYKFGKNRCRSQTVFNPEVAE